MHLFEKRLRYEYIRCAKEGISHGCCPHPVPQLSADCLC